MNSQNDKEGSAHIKSSIIVGVFTLLAACVGGIFLLLNTMVNNGFIVLGASNPSNSNSPATATVSYQQSPTENQPVLIQPTTASQVEPTAFSYCYGNGNCWKYDTNAQIMTWTGSTDGTEDIWQSAGEPLEKIRSGYTAIITTTVPGEIFACILSVDGKSVKNSCDGVLYKISAGTYKITSASNNVGGFRWCPVVGYGYRADGSGVCR